MDANTIGIGVIAWLLCAGLCAFLADARGKNVGLAIIWGLLFGILALVLMALTERIEQSMERSEEEAIKRDDPEAGASARAANRKRGEMDYVAPRRRD